MTEQTMTVKEYLEATIVPDVAEDSGSWLVRTFATSATPQDIEDFFNKYPNLAHYVVSSQYNFDIQPAGIMFGVVMSLMICVDRALKDRAMESMLQKGDSNEDKSAGEAGPDSESRS